jgi:cytochrome P450
MFINKRGVTVTMPNNTIDHQVNVLNLEQGFNFAKENVRIVEVQDAGSKPYGFPGPDYYFFNFLGDLWYKNSVGTLAHLENRYNQYGPLFEFNLGTEKVLAIADPKVAKELLKLQLPERFYKKNHGEGDLEADNEVVVQGKFWNALRENFGSGNFTGGNDWYNHRGELVKNLNQDLNHFVTIMQETLIDKFRATDEHQDIDLMPYMKSLAFDIIGRVMMGDSFDEKGQELRLAFTKIMKYLDTFAVVENTYLRRFLELTRNFWSNDKNLVTHAELSGAFADIEHVMHDIVSNYFHKLSNDEKFAATYITRILDGMDVDIEKFLQDDDYAKNIVKQVASKFAVIIFAGHETTSKVMAWLAYEFGRTPGLALKLREQIIDAMGDDYGFEPLNINAISEKVKLIVSVREETQRKYSPAVFAPRQVNKNILIEVDDKQYYIPANTPFLVSMLISQHLPEIWTNPETFSPERFMSKLTKEQREAYMPFAEGSHRCPGFIFSNKEIIAFIIHFVMSFDVELVTKPQDVHLDILSTLNPDELVVRFSRNLNEEELSRELPTYVSSIPPVNGNANY